MTAKVKTRFTIATSFLLLMSWLTANYQSFGEVRPTEMYYSRASNEPEVFKNDELARGLLTSSNNIIPSIIKYTDSVTRKIISYAIVLISIYLLFLLAKGITNNIVVSLMFPLFYIYNSHNWICLNPDLLHFSFAGYLFASPFIILSLKLLIDKRFLLSSIFAAISFYLHPGMCLWFLLAALSFIPIRLITDYFTKTKSPIKFIEACKSLGLFFGVFLILVSPRLYDILALHHQVSLIAPEIRMDLFKYSTFSQVSHLLGLVYYHDKFRLFVIYFSNLALLLLAVNSFRNIRDEKLQMIYYMYIGSFVILFLNEILVNALNFRFSIDYNVMRISGFNFLFLSLLLPVMVNNSLRRGRYLEFFCWILFIVNYTLIPPWMHSGLMQVAILSFILLVRFISSYKGLDSIFDKYIKQSPLLWEKVYKIGLTCFILSIIIDSGARYAYRRQKSIDLGEDYYSQAIRYINENNVNRSTVLYPFHKPREFLIFSRNPGFFNINFLSLFYDLASCDADIQKKAFIKFKEIEEDWGIDSIGQLKADPLNLGLPWKDAWAKKMGNDFIERWGEKYNIGYIIREKEYPLLSYKVVYENKGYLVYLRNTKPQVN